VTKPARSKAQPCLYTWSPGSPHQPPRHPRRTFADRPAPALPVRHQRRRMGRARPARPARPGRGCPIIYPRRDIVDAISYLHRTGCQWDALPADFPHHKLVYHYFKAWTADGILNRLHNHLREQVRPQVEARDRQPTAALVDSSSLRGAETVGRPSRGYDAGKRVNGRKRHIAVDTCGLLLAIRVTGAHVQDRDGARPLLWACTPDSRTPACSGPTPATPAGWSPGPPTNCASPSRSWPNLPGRPHSWCAPQVGGGADLLVDQQVPTHRPRLRAPTAASRRDGPVGDDHHHDPPPRPPPTHVKPLFTRV
jgi:transposase